MFLFSYRLCFAVFTTLPVSVQVCINGEPVLALQPDTQEGGSAIGRQTGTINYSANPVALLNEHRYFNILFQLLLLLFLQAYNCALFISILLLFLFSTNRYALRHLRHSAGEVTCASIDECLSLPMDAAISIRFHSSAMAQGFLSLRKL